MSPRAFCKRPPTFRPEARRRPMPAPGRLMWSRQNASSPVEAAERRPQRFRPACDEPGPLQFKACLRLRLNRSSKRARYGLRHAPPACPSPRSDPPDASAAWRRFPQMAREPEPDAGTLADAAAGTAAGRAVAPTHAAAAAFSCASGIEAGPPRRCMRCASNARIATRPAGNAQPNDPAAWGYAARSLTAGKIWRTAPPSRRDTSVAIPRFNGRISCSRR